MRKYETRGPHGVEGMPLKLILGVHLFLKLVLDNSLLIFKNFLDKAVLIVI